MKRALAALSLTGLGLGALLSYEIPKQQPITTSSSSVGQKVDATTPLTSTDSSTSPTVRSTSSTSSSSTTKTTAPSTSSASAGRSGTFTGAAVDTPWGPVQVSVTLKNGVLANLTATYSQSDPHTTRINSYAIPTLKQEALQTKSANISQVSGATYTSNAFISSLQSALSS